jgi:hypothetical protein
MDGADVARSLWSVEAVRDTALERVCISILYVCVGRGGGGAGCVCIRIQEIFIAFWSFQKCYCLLVPSGDSAVCPE